MEETMTETEGASTMKWTDAPPRTSRSGPVRVLLIDDDPDFLDTLREALTQEGLAVRTARTAGEALMHAVLERPDVILLDILLGNVDGIDVLEALRAEPETQGVPVLACTALGSRDSGRLLPRLGFDGLIAKPFEPRTLARMIRAHVPQPSEPH
jgi:DNA-binding response OmpR family regulator